MLELIIKIIIYSIMPITSFFIVRNLVKSNLSFFNIKTLIALVINTIPTILFYDSEYNSTITILTFFISIIVYKKIFKIKLSTSLLAMSIVMVLTALVDFIVIPIETFFIDYETIRNVWYISLSSNIIISILSILLSKINILKEKFQKFCLKIDSNSLISVVFFTIISFWILIIVFYYLSINLSFPITYIVSSAIIVMFLTLYYLYVKECNNYNSLNQEYNAIFKYIQTFEEWIDNEQMYRHELKNNLSIIRNMTKNKKIINKIDEMLKFSINLDENDIECLKDIPKGGLKGLIYYKIALAKSNNINLTIEISPKVRGKFNLLTTKDLKQICIILGIYIDNAMEASLKAKKNNVTLEIYESNNQLLFVISNTYKELTSINKMNFDGYTTKGEGHGRGLYYVNKLLARSKNIYAEQMFLNDYFIQKLFIKISEKNQIKSTKYIN